MPAYKKVRVSPTDLRARFNRDIQPRLQSGLYHKTSMVSRPAPATAHQPAGTRSVIYEITDQNGYKIATAHAYELPNGTLGGSGRLDPKSIRSGQTIYYI